MVITGVAARAGTRLAHLVYLDAFVPADGQPLLSLVSNEMAANVRAAAQAHGDGWRIPPLPPERYGVTNPKDVECLTRHLVPHPLKTVEQPVQAKERPSLKRTFIYCAKPAMGPFDQFVVLKNDRAWRFHELATGHDAMITAAPDLAKILADTAG